MNSDGIHRSERWLTRCIRQSFELSDTTYGSPRVWHDLRANGERCGHNHVARLMRQAQLEARHRGPRQPASSTDAPHGVAPIHLQRRFQW